MKHKSLNWKEFMVALVAFIVIDAAYLSHAVKNIYKPGMYPVGKEYMNNSDVIMGVVTWILLALGIKYFVMPLTSSPTNAFTNGALMGLIIYGVYNLTNKATLKAWDTKMMCTDIVWGTFLSGLVAWIVYHYRKSNKKVSWRR